jgi:hypothetical protein
MNALFHRSDPNFRLQALALIAVLTVGAAARVYVMSHYEPAAGDGLLRALMAEWWVRGLSPLDHILVKLNHAHWTYMRLPITGPWPPGHTLLAGLFILVFRDPVFFHDLA